MSNVPMSCIVYFHQVIRLLTGLGMPCSQIIIISLFHCYEVNSTNNIFPRTATWWNRLSKISSTMLHYSCLLLTIVYPTYPRNINTFEPLTPSPKSHSLTLCFEYVLCLVGIYSKIGCINQMFVRTIFTQKIFLNLSSHNKMREYRAKSKNVYKIEEIKWY